MTPLFLAWGGFGGWELILVLALVLIFFGPKKLPDLARSLGKAKQEFQKGMREVSEEIEKAGKEEPKESKEPKPTNGASPENLKKP